MTGDSNFKNIKISAAVEQHRDELVRLRRAFHERAELGHAEFMTKELILAELKKAGIEAGALGQTGVLGIIRGARPGKVLLIRADMDALPIEEENDVSYKSKNTGVMHACGHDAHMAMLIGLGKLLGKRPEFCGTVKLLFQPAEEGEGGAQQMIDAGVLENPEVDCSLAFHVWTPYAIGQVVALSGTQAASVDGFRIRVKGRGAHAARPEEGVDPISIAAQIISAAQFVKSRMIGALDPVVLSFTSVHGGTAFNIIPEEVEILGTIRALNEETRRAFRERLKEVVSQTARLFGGEAHYESLTENIPVVNDPALAELLRETAGSVVGPENVISPPPLMVGEDIGEIQDRVPGVLALLGCGNARAGIEFPHHHPRFQIDERVLEIGVQVGFDFTNRVLR